MNMKTVVATLNAKYIHMNLALRYLKAYAMPEFDVEMAEYTIKDPIMNIVSDLYNRKPDVIGFSCYIWNTELTIQIIELLKKVMPDVRIILGGPEVSYDCNYWLERAPEIDCIVMGEGEATFKELLHVIKNGLSFDDVLGIAYRKNGVCKVNPARPKIDLRKMPSPFRFSEDVESLPSRVVYIETSRGCPFTCQFCLSSVEVGVRYFNREAIKDDLRYLMDHGVKTIKFVDRTFNISRSYAMEMFQFLIDEHTPGVVFQFEITGDIMRPEVIQYLNEHAPKGLFRFEIGVQSTNDYTNQLVKRRQNFEKLTRTVKMIKEGGKVVQHLDLIAGLPEENYQSFRKTFNDVFALRPEEIQLGFLKMLRGTGLRTQANTWDYQYMNHAPYEILSNNCLTFDEVIKIKQVEDILEKYWNDHRMDLTVEYLTTYIFPSPFDFFQQFGTFWAEQGWSKIGHQLEDLFKRLATFLTQLNNNNLEEALNLMKFDYLSNQKLKPRKTWWHDQMDKSEKDIVFSLIGEITGIPQDIKNMDQREFYKYIRMEKFSFDVEHFRNGKEIVGMPCYLLFYYDGNGTCEYYQIPASFFQNKLQMLES